MWLFLAVVTLFAGCGPPGPRALLEGKRLLEQGKYPQAIENLRAATVLLGGTNALAFHYLGLACQEAGESSEAERSYQRALALNHDLTEVHYNLGCLWLEQNKLEQAKAELTAFTLRRGNAAEGWLKLGAVQLRASEPLSGEARSRELALAEKSFNEALHLSSQNPEALTGLGLARLRRGRAAEAAQYFRNALKEQPGYPPALLNLAIVAQANLNDRELALEKYRAYAGLKPPPENVEAVKSLIHQLELDLNPPRLAFAKPGAPAGSNLTSAKPSAPDPTRNTGFASQTGQTSRLSGERAAPTITEAPVSSTKSDVAGNPLKQAPLSAPLKPLLPVAISAYPSNVEHVTLLPEPIFKSAQDVSSAHATVQTTEEPLITAPPVPTTVPPTKPAKHGFFQKLNPAKLFERDHDQPATNRLTPLPSTAVVAQADAASAEAQREVAGRRYAYRPPPQLPPGNRSDAERVLAQGVQAHQAQRFPEATQAYRKATQLDPSFYNAWFNLGLAATDSGNLALALTAYECALVLRPDSLDARYKFAFALKQDNYWLDAANELEKILKVYPNESRVHLALGNLCAQQFHQPARARQHYLKVLETDPRNPQASNIRYWLTDNPL